ncbi:conserved hypothetical protein [Vibrio nigripulchritudo SO65]|uniref:hypothetical protein n=1 Tax=Vibrio nigripulchritudo TaxID=28173 RepID=UPI0003B1A50A|nr:hypothetical protein [Vibrio nigripulchritudo]CCN36814.1 conserved hypothetical protein [Vibrio nigripulchritudo AM115]CCN44590.1 conserved hypothetical protein [Vibrio nigripulchritudo FTn2]CCN66549.1 conserved hypothetical protein [Vibrio nigripulchritudo POn4]CCN76185.1 conserved hypothetical protein [Vibrio nigripulchritudo SO65]
MSDIKEPLKTVLKRYCHIECYDPELIKRAVVSGKGFPYDFELFKEQLREAIDKSLISPSEYEQLTEEDFDSIEDLNEWLEELVVDLS